MMLELRPNCEWCDVDLPPQSAEARICSYECTYCADCVDNVLFNVCPTCGGNFAPRPIRPKQAYRDSLQLGLANQPAGTARKHSKFTAEELSAFVGNLKDMPPDQR
ncbi:MAG: DUF1272 domain-containing protein [Rhizobiaceae bacterium]